MSDALHGLYRERLARGTWRDKPRPVLINNWEATYFGFDESKLVEIATSARDLGVELFVLDDGWFGQRDSDDSSLGDWFVDRRKLPNGLDGLAAKVEALGIKFGLWIEPEMISERSRLFEEHPDWAVGIPGRPRTESRQQFVLDMSRPEIVDHLFGVLSDVLASAPISYIKWDFNRTITEPYSIGLPPDRQGEFFHRFVLGTYDLYARLDRGLPGRAVRVVRGRRRPVRPGDARLRAAGLDERRHRRGRAPRDPVGDVDGVPAELDGGARRGGPEPPDRPHHADRHARRGRVLRGLRLRARPDRVERRGPGVRRGPDRLLQGAPRRVPARPVRPAAQPVRGGGADRLDGHRRRMAHAPSSATTRSSIARSRPPTGSASAAWTRPVATASPAGRTSQIRSSATTSASGAATS